MARMTGTDMSEIFSNFVNSGLSYDFEQFAEKITTDHKTIQDDSFRMMFKCMEKWHTMYKEGNYDGRNEGSLKLAYEMIESLKEKGLY